MKFYLISGMFELGQLLILMLFSIYIFMPFLLQNDQLRMESERTLVFLKVLFYILRFEDCKEIVFMSVNYDLVLH